MSSVQTKLETYNRTEITDRIIAETYLAKKLNFNTIVLHFLPLIWFNTNLKEKKNKIKPIP